MRANTPNLLLLGPPGAGKGTQAKKLELELGLARLDTGALIRMAIAEKSDLGRQAKAFVDAGKLVPNDLIVDFVLGELLRLKQAGRAFLLDGFPRNLAQAKALDETLITKNLTLDRVIEIQVDPKKLIDRISGRWLCANKSCGAVYHLRHVPPRTEGQCDLCGNSLIQRADDIPEVIGQRVVTYQQETKPLSDYYAGQGKLVQVEGDQAQATVLAEIKQKLGLL